ncbi:30S ribosomal protein S19 [Candidatus Woesearchaeota archaeon]|nr:30S ribosomal protein S19 [Candidatus Woesearchaeota archaeon]
MAKIAKWYGKTEEEIKKMDMDQFMKLVPSRIRRTLKHGLNQQQKKVIKKVGIDHKNIRTQSRDMPILPSMLGKTIKVYSGKEYLPVVVTLDMLGHVLGEFVMTRKSVTHGSAGLGATRSSKGVSAK